MCCDTVNVQLGCLAICFFGGEKDLDVVPTTFPIAKAKRFTSTFRTTIIPKSENKRPVLGSPNDRTSEL